LVHTANRPRNSDYQNCIKKIQYGIKDAKDFMDLKIDIYLQNYNPLDQAYLKAEF
jgi:hypothetical protein